jgi:hypothetical protein
MEYIGQTGRRFSTRYKEHIHDIRQNSSSTGYSEHILNTGHTYGTMENTMDIIETNKKGQYLNTLENYHIYRATRKNTHMNNINRDIHNSIFKELCMIYTEQHNSTPNPCGGGVEYLHRDPASRKRRRNGTKKKGRAIA